MKPLLMALTLGLAAHAAMGQGKSAPPAAPPVQTNGFDLPMGSGPGMHSPNSPFAPLKERADIVPWSVLTGVKTRNDKNRLLPAFGAGQLTLHQKIQRVQGFMVPLDANEKQTHFLLTSVPLTCAFCIPGGPESMIEVKAKTPVKYTLEPVIVEGRFTVLPDDQYGLYYRVVDAVGVQ
ncbi:hypothetical protein RD110_14270 [Rhodoferax koreense]|uniref:DUF3299 domain-containing protein n=1 Tax=Rhodoferax koreensis TaxID=1842727 RepID=A0A1P8JWT8_9BURK|nr:DUF3299 domain-containing protein [Rhodoferax koreense]APW38220.1 hypothetical protein RD110_14270 [Rhodoferax koreense]